MECKDSDPVAERVTLFTQKLLKPLFLILIVTEQQYRSAIVGNLGDVFTQQLETSVELGVGGAVQFDHLVGFTGRLQKTACNESRTVSDLGIELDRKSTRLNSSHV